VYATFNLRVYDIIQKIMNEMYVSIKPAISATFASELENCLMLVARDAKEAVGRAQSIVKQTVFIKSSDAEDFYSKKRHAISQMNDIYTSTVPPTSYIGQIPEPGMNVVMELIVVDADVGTDVTYKAISGAMYSVVSDSSRKKIFVAGLAGSEGDGIHSQTVEAFDLMREILRAENMDFSHVVRQWNYIEKILAINEKNGSQQQNYQIFNEIRSDYYKDSTFRYGYPAATGIGMNEGGFVIEFIAVKPVSDSFAVIPITNPLQIDAHAYTKEVLVGELSTPKFERAKCVMGRDAVQIYISGTASIRDQREISETDIEIQTLVTIDNIKKLISRENLSRNGIELQVGVSDISFLRVYVKHPKDIAKVKSICEQNFKNAKMLILTADICRDRLLVEMEGYISVRRQSI
jgi:enamine deaminase RidA (YjgF/YER057c/UK114 family)